MSTSKNKLSVQTLVRCAMIAAVYTVLCLVLQPFSYGAVQVRVAEAFCLLPVFGAEYIVGVRLIPIKPEIYGALEDSFRRADFLVEPILGSIIRSVFFAPEFRSGREQTPPREGLL